MAFTSHIHNFPRCDEGAHNTSCPSNPQRWLCDLIQTGMNKGRYLCRHIPPNGLPRREMHLLKFVSRYTGRARRK